jgi:hypothetical protein
MCFLELLISLKFIFFVLFWDYNLLEEVKRVAEAASRMRSKLDMYTNFRLPHHLKSLQNAVRSWRTQLLFLPNGMSKREKNRSQYDHRYFYLSRQTICVIGGWYMHNRNFFLLYLTHNCFLVFFFLCIHDM